MSRLGFVLRWGIALPIVGLLVAAGAPVPDRTTISSTGPSAQRPNIIFILSDDEDVALHSYMPKTKALLHDSGTTFDNYFVTYALCCPSRATTLRGQYPHNTRIEGNAPPTGGYQKFRSLGHDSSTVATWLQASGYHTAMLGKYMNGYQPGFGPPAGWSEWYGVGNGYRGYDYTMNENGTLVQYGRRPQDFLVDVIAHKAAEVIRRAAAAQTPVFLFISPFVPHGPATPAPRHETLFADARLPHPASFDEADMSDKPRPLADRDRLAPRMIERMENLYRLRLRSLQSVDDLVDSIVTALRSTGGLENSYIIYTSDNGFHMGEHRLAQGKNTPYEMDIRVPFVVRGPGVPAGRHEPALVLNNDLAPTFADIAGARAPGYVDGRSFLSLLSASRSAWSRTAFLISRRGGREAQQEPGDGDDMRSANSFNAIRTARYTYVEYGNGALELYDLSADPDQLANLAGVRGNSEIIGRLSRQLATLARCAGASCRAAEDATPR
ncbi:MAG: sulfatase [Gemmatimonadaceae bacterium]|nr:sulfatase [Gemmatimonadaceae bacterium]